MNKEEIIAGMNTQKPAFLSMLNSQVVDVDKRSCTMEFTIDEKFCHSGNVIQGGFITAMLDSVSSHAVFVLNQSIVNVSTLELKVSFYKASLAGKFKAIGRVDSNSYKTAFVSADLINEEGIRTASLTATAKIVYDKSKTFHQG